MALYTTQTAEAILQRALARVPARFDKRVGSVIYDAIMPAALELATCYKELDYLIDQSFADTAEREYLIRRAAERGLAPTEASAAIVTGVFTPEALNISIGSRFTCGEYNYFVTEKVSDGRYYLKCETVGTAPNSQTGRLIPIATIPGLKTAELIEVSILGEDAEETEVFRQRYYDVIKSEIFGGNVADYKYRILGIPGVGGVKVYPAWNGGATVRCVVINSDYGVPTETLVTQIQTEIDPLVIEGEDSQGQGLGLAPIGHFVTIQGANTATLNVQSTLTYRSGYTYEGVKSEIEAILKAYYYGLNQTWANSDNLIVRIAEINSQILQGVYGVIDIADTTINGTAANLVIDADAVAVFGSFAVN